MEKHLQLAHALQDEFGRWWNEGRVARSCSSDPVLAPAKLAGFLVASATARQQDFLEGLLLTHEARRLCGQDTRSAAWLTGFLKLPYNYYPACTRSRSCSRLNHTNGAQRRRRIARIAGWAQNYVSDEHAGLTSSAHRTDMPPSPPTQYPARHFKGPRSGMWKASADRLIEGGGPQCEGSERRMSLHR